MNLGNQRWRERRAMFRRPEEQIHTREYGVVEMSSDGQAKAFVVEHHYSGSFPAARFRFGLYHRSALVGVAVFSHPCRDEVLTNVFPGRALDSVELGRFVLLDEVPGNGETWFLARCFELLRGRVRGVVSFSDPHPRERLDGTTVFAGHVGTIYQAANARYLGAGQRRSLRLLPDGRVFSARAISKIRAGHRGWWYSAQTLVEFGADPLLPGDDARAWLAAWLPRLTRQTRHPGHHRYAWGLARSAMRVLPVSQAYPKRRAA